MKSILFDCHHYSKSAHGVKIILEAITDIKESKYKLVLGVEKKNYDYVNKRIKNKDIEIIPYKFGGIFRFIIDLPNLIKSKKIDIFYGQYFIPLFLNKRTKYFVSIHDVLYEEFTQFFSASYIYLRKLMVGFSARNSDGIHTISEYSKQSIIKYYKIDPAKIEVIYPPIIKERRKNTNPSNPKNQIIYVSRFEKRKNHLTLISSLRKFLLNNEFKLILVGFDTDGYKNKCMKFVDSLKLTDNVAFMENVQQNQLEELIIDSYAVIYPSICEGFGMPIIEALEFNPNVLFSNTTAMAEFDFLKDNMFDPFSEKDILAKVKQLKINNDSKIQTHKKIQDILIDRYGYTTNINKLRKFIGLR